MTMKTLIALGAGALSLAAPALHAQDYARVVSSTPLVQQVVVPRQICTTQQVMVEQPRSGAGALLGAVAGGAVGNAIGDGSGRAAATVIGVIGGAMLGNRIEGPAGYRLQDQTTCATRNFHETRTVGYMVTYEYAGRHYQVQTAQDPGGYIRVEVSPQVQRATVYGAEAIAYDTRPPGHRRHPRQSARDWDRGNDWPVGSPYRTWH